MAELMICPGCGATDCTPATCPAYVGQSEARRARDGRALVIANLLRSGWTGHEVSVGLKIIDAGGGVELAMTAMREAQTKRRDERSDQAQDRSSRLVGAEREPTPETPLRGRA